MHSDKTSKLGHGIAKVLQIKRNYRDPLGLDDPVTRGESTFSAGTADTYVEDEPTTVEWLTDLVPSPQQLNAYFWSLFPFTHWIMSYNVQWLIGDLVAGEYLFLFFHNLYRIPMANDNTRYHRRCRCRAAEYGICQAR